MTIESEREREQERKKEYSPGSNSDFYHVSAI